MRENGLPIEPQMNVVSVRPLSREANYRTVLWMGPWKMLGQGYIRWRQWHQHNDIIRALVGYQPTCLCFLSIAVVVPAVWVFWVASMWCCGYCAEGIGIYSGLPTRLIAGLVHVYTVVTDWTFCVYCGFPMVHPWVVWSDLSVWRWNLSD